MHEQRIAFLRPGQIAAELARFPVAYMPFGLLEWHGPHLPYGTDAFNAEQACLLAAENTGGLVFPPCFLGTERERSSELLDWLGFAPDTWIVGMDFPANTLPSLYASEEVFTLAAREQIRLAVLIGFRGIVLVTGHGAQNQITALERLAAEFSAAGPVRVIVALPFVRNEAGVMEVGHASRVETALMLALHPHSVDLAALPPLPERLHNVDWAIVDYQTFSGDPMPDRTVHDLDDPRRASAEEGAEILRRASQQIAAQVRRTWELGS